MSWVTVIVPVYNMERYVDRCIESVVQQTDGDFSLLLIVDGATDRSLERCLAWAERDARIVVVQKRNEGLGETRNLGVRMADTEYVTFLDADDWWSPDYLETMRAGTEEGRNDIVLCDIDFVNEQEGGYFLHKDSRLRFSPGRLEAEQEPHLLARARTFAWGKLYRRSLFHRQQTKQPAHAYEDVSTVPFLITQARSIYYVAGARYHYWRNRQGSIVNQFHSLRDLALSLQELKQRFANDGSWERYHDQLRQIFWGQLCFAVHCLAGWFVAAEQRERDEVYRHVRDVVLESFPELEKMMRAEFHTEDALLQEALCHIAMEKEYLVEVEERQQYRVIYQAGNAMKEAGARHVIAIPRPARMDCADKETLIWNLADEIFAKMFDESTGEKAIG